MPATSRPIDLPLLLGIAALAWWPLLIERPVASDDFLNGELIRGGLAAYWDKYGVWRIIGHPLPFLLRDAIPYGDRVVAIVTHFATLLLFHLSLRRLFVSHPINLAVSLFLAVTPFGFQALTWNSALTFALSTAFCLGAFLAVLRPVDHFTRALAVGFAGGALGFLSLSANEATLLLVPWVAFCPVVLRRRFSDSLVGERDRWRPAILSALIILAFQVSWVVLHLATKEAAFHKNPAFHAAALVSGFFRQYQQVTYLMHLPQLGAWLPVASWLSALAACGLVVPTMLRSARTALVSRPRWLEALYFAVLPIAAVAIYALAGGFSTDARKAYVLWPFLLISSAFFLQALSVPLQRSVLVVALLCCPIFLLSTHATTRIWSQTATLFEPAYRKIQDADLAGPYRFVWRPNVYEVWPDFDNLCGFRFDTPHVVDAIVGQRPSRPDGSALTLVWNEDRMTWNIEGERAAGER